MPILDIDGQKIDVDKQILELDRADCEDSLYTFLRGSWRYIDPAPFTDGWPIEAVAEHLQAVVDGDIKRLIINMPPRHTKSEFASYLLPAWFLGRFPHKKIIQCSNTAELAVGFGRKIGRAYV